jgi:hypothetical protein
MNENSQPIHDQQKQYWAEMVKLKASSLYIRYYRDSLGRKVTKIAAVRAVASSVSIGGWALWQRFAWFWGLIIATSQVADALKDVFPFAKTHKAANELTVALDRFFIDAQLEWDNIFSGKYTNEEISTRLHKLRTLQPQAEQHNFPDGLAEQPDLKSRARQDAVEYFWKTYGVRV